ncbi:MAG: DNA internalization-related competence protein ComEC/Rec2, partial [Myxococcales bacterium]|nr:DNA internalization-related competence protein ComEC/Rec2 [Myxococcales bacterium]
RIDALGASPLRASHRRVRIRGVRALPGERIGVIARTFEWTAYRNPTPHPPWPTPPRVELDASARSTARLSKAKGAWLERARHHVRERFIETLPPGPAEVAMALVLGEGDAVSEDVTESIRDAGLAHVLAVSGLHVALVLWALGGALRAVFRRVPSLARRLDVTRIAATLMVTAAPLVASFAGGGPSAWRAGFTAALHYGCIALGRRPAPLRLLGASVVLIGLASPDDLTRPALALSSIATLVLLTAHPPAEPTPPELLRFAAWTSARVSLATLPVVAWCFGRVSWIGIVANVALVPFASVALIPLAFAHAVTATCGFGTAMTGPLLTFACDAFTAGSDWFARVPAFEWPPLSVWEGLAMALVASALAFLQGRRRWALAFVGVVAFGAGELVLRVAERPHDVLRVTFLDVGQGDAALVDLPDGGLMLIDAGGAGASRDPGELVIAPLLRARRRDHIDVVAVTHAHPDHYGGLAALLRRLPIRALWTNRQGPDEVPDGEFATMLRAAQARGIKVKTERDLCGHPHGFGRALVRVLAPCPGYDAGYDLNDNSMVLALEFAGRRVLMAGDIEAAGEAKLATRWRDGTVDVLKVPHHGSRTSSSDALLRAIRPSLAVASAGRRNRFGHPHAEVVERYRRARIPLFTTPERGGCIVEIDSGGRIQTSCAIDGPTRSAL